MKTAFARIGVALWAIAVGFVECALTTAAIRQESTAASHIVSQTTTKRISHAGGPPEGRCRTGEMQAARTCS
jgi:hypothetical protein